MKQLLAVIGLVFLSGCATTPPESPWTVLSTETEAATPPLNCGAFPLPSEATDAFIVYDETGVNALEVYRTCSEANEANVNQHAAQILQLKVARKSLVEAGKAQRNIANMKQEMLEEERRSHLFQSLGYWALIIGLGSAL